ncbi:4-hydroxy-tetrahydrodipicolinate synthase [Bradyrhizobium sp. 1.29L]
MGYIPDLPTPFDKADRIDLGALERLCEYQIAAGASGLVVCETAGEASTLSDAERDIMVRAAVEIARGRTRIIVGAGSNSTNRAIETTRRAEMAGADAVLSVVPYYNKPMQNGIYAHFRAIAESTGLPIILHDAPGWTARELANDTLLRLAESKQFVGLRDGTGDINRSMRLRTLLRCGFRWLSGDDGTALAYIAQGGHGCVSLVANVRPDLCQAIFCSVRQGRFQTAQFLQEKLAPLESCLSKESPAALKYALSFLGLMHPGTRLPIVELDEAARAVVAKAVAGTDGYLAGAVGT